MVPVRIGDRAGDGVASGEGPKRQLVAGIVSDTYQRVGNAGQIDKLILRHERPGGQTALDCYRGTGLDGRFQQDVY